MKGTEEKINKVVRNFDATIAQVYDWEWRFGETVGIGYIPKHPTFGEVFLLWKNGELTLVDQYNWDDERDTALWVQGKKNRRAHKPSVVLEVLDPEQLTGTPVWIFELYYCGGIPQNVIAIDGCDAFRVAAEKGLPIPDWTTKKEFVKFI